MKKKLLDFMQGRFGILLSMAVLLSAMFPAKALLAGQEQVDFPTLAGAQGVDKRWSDEAHPTEICKLLTNKNASEKAQIKSREIAKRGFKGEYTNTQYGVRVEIIGEVKEINVNGQSGIELFAKAWRDDKQLGFGKDGSVEIERFRIFNPPILVDDPNGTIIKEWIDKQGQTRQRKLQENPIEAIKQVIAHNVKLVGKENANIIMGKIGNTTDTFYADAGDALVRKSDTNFATARNAAGADAVHSTSAVGYPSVGLEAGTTYNFYIAFHMFDTSAIAATDTIDSATYSFFLGGDNGGTAGNQWAITQSTQTTWNSLSGGDYGKRGSTEGATRQNRKVAAETGYQDFALNATGLTWVARSGETKPASASASGKTQLVMAWAKDLDNSAPTTNDYNDVRFADQTGTANDPKLVVVHSAAVVVTPTPTPTPTDTTAPSGSISINSGASYTNSTTVTLSLSATDSVGVTGYYLSDSSTIPSASASGWTSVTSTTSYSATVSYTLSSGEGNKTIYAWYKDAAGNVSSTANATITLDTTVPTVTISSPTSSSTCTSTSSTISLGGSASDSSSGISSVAWSNNRGGNGTATGTASWTIFGVSLSSGDNVITVTAKDGANNSGTDTLQVTYGTSSTVSAPTVSTGSASNVTTSSATLNGTVNANGGTTTAWFQYGSTSGSYGNTSSTQTVTGSSNTTVSIGISGLSSGTTYYYRVAASNSGGTSYGSESSFTTSTATATPTPTPSTGDSSAPTDGSIIINSGASYTNSTGVTLTLSAKDNTGVTGYYLSQNSSTPSSSASGWTSVSSSTSYSGSVSYTLSGSDGNKTVYVWYKDAAGNVSSSASDDITLDTTSPTINITSPTSDATYTATSSTINLGGSASDSTSGIKEVTWTNSSGGSGTASGTTSWTISNISLTNGDTTITVTAKDNGGNTATDTITVTYKSSSTNVPKVSTGSATNVTETSATLNGTVNANGLTTTAWFNYGTTSGLYSSPKTSEVLKTSPVTINLIYF